MRIGICGAGIGGLTTALVLLHAGFDVEVYEQVALVAELGAGLQLSPNGTRVLQALGLEDALAPLVVEPAGKEVRLWNTGQAWKLFDLGADCRARFGAPYWMVHRADLHGTLFKAVRSRGRGVLHLGQRVTGVEQDAGGVDVKFTDGSTRRVDALVGADGVHSKLREHVMPGGQRAEFTGLMAWRGLALANRVAPAFRAPVGTNWVGPGGHVIMYPVRGGELINIVGITERSDWRAESWNDPGTREEMVQDFPGWNADLLEAMCCIDQPFKWALLGREPRRAWAQGRVAVLGDAAHPTLPFLAQGANMAIEDAAVLGRCLERCASPEAALQRYEELRWERTAAIVNGSRENAWRFHNDQLADPATAEAYIDSEWAPEKVRRRYDWLFEYDPLAVEP